MIDYWTLQSIVWNAVCNKNPNLQGLSVTLQQLLLTRIPPNKRKTPSKNTNAALPRVLMQEIPLPEIVTAVLGCFVNILYCCCCSLTEALVRL